MEVFIDKANLISLIQTARTHDELFSDCTRMLKRFFNIRFTFDKKALEITDQDSKDEKEVLLLVKQWLGKMVSGIGDNQMIWNCDTPVDKPLHKDSFKGIIPPSRLSDVYLLDDENAEIVSGRGGILVSPVGKEIETLGTLIFDDFQFSKKIPIRKMSNWNVLADLLCPTTDILIVDKYLFLSPEIYVNNVYDLCEKLIKYANNLRVNLVFVTLNKYRDNVSKSDIIPNWKTIKENLRKRLSKIAGIKPNVTFVISSGGNFPEHDRLILTNYRYIYSGDTFNYFDSNWNVISKGRDLTVSSHGNKDNYISAQELISDIQKHISKIFKLSPDNIIGDKESNYFKFS